MNRLSKLFEPLEAYSPLQRRGFLLLLLMIFLLFVVAELWRSYKIRHIKVDTTDYLVLRQWAADLRDTLSLRIDSTSKASKFYKTLYDLPKEDLNTATALELQRIQGIGIVLSRRIVLYREALGGFHNLGQLNEIRRLNRTVQDRISWNYIPKSKVKLLRINHISADSLALHPYFSNTFVKEVITKRPFLDILDFNRQVSLTKEVLVDLRPYLSFSP